nr:hypothetical protein BaRGS_013250 [Batillaria attramentaria]
MGAQGSVFVTLAAICVLQTSLLVTFTVLHVHRYHELQDSYHHLTHRAKRVLLSCGQPSEAEVSVQHVRQARQAAAPSVTQIPTTANAATPDPFIAHLTTEQEAILERHCSGDIKLCIPGPKGEPGLLGIDGQQGPQGATGDQGPKGVRGAKGDTGPAGPAGQQGPQGPKGDQGEAGQAGLKGATGAAGAKGDTGPKGAAGKSGVQGQRGVKGDTGDAGPAGVAGVAGEAGVKGAPGPGGQAGPKGAAGRKGESGAVPGKTCSCFSRSRPTGSRSQTEQALPGSTVTLSCPVIGAPPPEITWTRAGGRLPANAVRKGNDLVITDMKQNDVGKYVCHAKNILGETTITVDLSMFDLACDFEQDYCAWKQGRGDKLDWTLNKGSTSTIFTGPDIDHTTNSVLGQYAYLEANSGSAGDTAQLESPSVQLDAPLCMTFWYNMYGADIDSLTVLSKSSSGTETQLWRLTGNQGQGWKMASVSVPPVADGGQTKVIIRASKKLGIEGDVAIDDISITTGQCTSTPESVSCDFQADMCGWQKEGAWSWTRHKGQSGKPNTGPTADHNNEATKFYGYLDGGSVPNSGAKGRLTTPMVNANDKQACVDFYYHMFGYGVGSLTLKVKSDDGSEYALWQRASDQGQNWNHARVTLPVSSNPYRLVFEATRGANAASDIAVDDVNVTTGACPLGGELGQLGCDFELLTTCQWKQKPDDALNWQLQQAGTGGRHGGPTKDHTLQTDRGIYATVTGNSGQEAALNSIPLERNNPFCLQLWYYIPNANSGEIVIYREERAYFHSAEDSLPSLAPLRIPLGSKLVKDDIVRDLVFESTETI